MSLLDLRLQEIHQRLQDKSLTVSELVEESLQRIAEVDQQIQALLQ